MTSPISVSVRRRRFWLGAALVTLFVMACASNARPAAAPPTALTPTGTSAAVTTSAPDPTSRQTALPTDEPTSAPAPTPEPTVAPTPTVTPTNAPPVAIATISFGADYTESTNDVSLSKVTSEFEDGQAVAWRVELPPANGTETIMVEVTDETNHVVYNGTHDPDAGSNVFFGKAVVANIPGSYTMRYLLNGEVIAQGLFEIAAAAPEADECDPSYPDFCIPSSPPDLDCKDVEPHKNFTVRGDDPHRFDADNDGLGCEPFSGPVATPKPKPTRKPNKPDRPDRNCDPSYPTLCLRSSPDLDCGEINATNFPVRGRDPHGFDGDGDGVGCES